MPFDSDPGRPPPEVLRTVPAVLVACGFALLIAAVGMALHRDWLLVLILGWSGVGACGLGWFMARPPV